MDIIRYVTEGTFDAYLYQVIETKQKFISQIMTSKSPARSIEDVDMTALSYAEIKALASGNPEIKEKMDLDIEVSRLQLMKQNYLSQKYELESKITHYFPKEIKRLEERIDGFEKDIQTVRENTPSDRETFPPMEIQGAVYMEKKEAGNAIIAACKGMTSCDEISIGQYRGLKMGLYFESFSKEYVLVLFSELRHKVTLGTDIYGNVTRIDNLIAGFLDKQENCKEKLKDMEKQLANAEQEVKEPFTKEEELQKKLQRLKELDTLLSFDEKDLTVEDNEVSENTDKKEAVMCL